MNQLEMFAPPQPRPAGIPAVENVRQRLEAVLRQMRDRSSSGWSEAEKRRWSVVFPQMCEWLPEEERAELRDEFKRLATNIAGATP